MSEPATTQLCKLCHERSDFVDAHIVPSSFYPVLDRAKESFLLLSNNPNVRMNRSRTGIYDRELVCAGCEKIFDPFDDYAAKLLLDGKDRHRLITHDGKPLAYEAEAFDYPKLKLFLLSMLWRAAESTRPEFSKVQLGPYLPELRPC